MENIKVIDVSGIHTEVYARIPIKYSPLKIVIVPGTVNTLFPQPGSRSNKIFNNNDKSNINCYIIGNPGIVDFYVDFVDLLFDKFGQKHSVLIGAWQFVKLI
jgi:hypothetical protein